MDIPQLKRSGTVTGGTYQTDPHGPRATFEGSGDNMMIVVERDDPWKDLVSCDTSAISYGRSPADFRIIRLRFDFNRMRFAWVYLGSVWVGPVLIFSKNWRKKMEAK